MTELSGTLDGVGLPAIVRFLAGLEKTGALRIAHENLAGEVYFASGEVVAARLGSHGGLQAFDALMQVLPGGAFAFDSEAQSPAEGNLQLTGAELQAHLDGITTSGPALPSLDATPQMAAQDDDDGKSEETVPLDRGTLQTLLAVDGQRTVREIIGVRGSFEALWQIANLAELGLVRLNGAAAPASGARPKTSRKRTSRPADVAPAKPEPVVAPAAPEPVIAAAAPVPVVAPAAPEPAVAAATPEPVVAPAAPEPVTATAEATVAPIEPPAPAAAPVTPFVTPAAEVHCPKLGFEDDPASSFGRPTRLHRCFAAGSPLPLSLDQQRELCLSDQYGTCPRLAMAGVAGQAPTELRVEEAATEDPRIVRLPIGGRAANAGRAVASVAAEPAPPTPLRARAVRTNGTAAVAEPVDEPVADVAPTPVGPPRRPARVSTATIAEAAPRRLGALTLPSASLTGIGIVVLVLVVVGVLLAPHLGNLFTDEEGVDLSSLPNASAVAQGTPIADLPAVRPTAAAAAAAAQTEAAQPTLAPTVAPTAAPKPTVAPTAVPAAAGPRSLFEESFDDNSHNWPNNNQGTAWITGGTYRIATRQAGQFVAVGVPAVGEILQDVVVNATFHKVGGPAGGGYGIIVRDQGPGPRDGQNQQGRYYVLEVGDKGEVGIWRRDGDRWIDLLPWTRSDAVRPGTQSNELSVRAVGDRLSLSVNGTEVGVKTDGTLAVGNVGLFVGGDGNQVAVDQLEIKTP